MFSMARALRRAGYGHVCAPTLAYHLRSLEELSERLLTTIEGLPGQGDGLVDFVTHSYGGILARSVLDRASVRRVVMLSPPNQGAELAERIRERLPVHKLGWDPLAQLLPGVPAKVGGTRGAEIGILTGGLGEQTGFNRALSGDNDGKVRVDEARLEGAKDFRVLPVRHPFIMMAKEVQRLTIGFLTEGHFPD